ncbi:plasmid mobilization protein [Rubrivirga litoralis]|uniref:plasmid mobilization protein n=1 Tax=Rubrivirga litoralis TaxID=3075598 RepID=UPI003D773606
MTDGASTSPPPETAPTTARKPRKKGGRPPGVRRGEKVEVRVSGAEKADLRAAATEAGITVSEYVRRRSLGRPVTARADRETRVLLRRIGVNLNQLARTANTSGAAPPEAELADSLDHLRRVLTGLE